MLFLENGKLRAILIREGVSINKNRWTRKVLEQIAKIADGVPVNLYDLSKKGDGTVLAHWEMIRQRMPPFIQNLLPEHLPGAQVGTVRNPTVTVGTDGKAQVEADIETTTDTSWFASFVSGLVSSGKKLGVSIHVPPDGATFQEQDGVREPQEVTRIVGFDAVSFPSAGGQFVPALEALGAATQEEDRMKFKNLVKRLLALAPQGKRDSLAANAPGADIDMVSALVESHKDWCQSLLEAINLQCSDEGLTSFLEGVVVLTPENPEKPKAKVEPTRRQDPVVESVVSRDEFQAMNETIQRVVKQNSRALVESVIRGAELPAEAGTFVRAHFGAVIESQGVVEEASLNSFVAGLKKASGAAKRSSTLESDDDGPSINVSYSQYDTPKEFLAALEGMVAGVDFIEVEINGKKQRIDSLKSVRQAYGIATGDVFCEGRDYWNRIRAGRRAPGLMGQLMPVFMESVTQPDVKAHLATLENTYVNTGDNHFPALLSEYMHKQLAKEYKQQPMLWRELATPETVTDFKTWRWLRDGEFPNLPSVAEAGDYVEWAGAGPNEEEVTLQIEKKGGIFKMSWEVIVNDDTRKIQRFPSKAARAAIRTLNAEVFNIVVTNSGAASTTPDGVVLAHASHNNLIASAYSFANAKLMRKQMAEQKDLGWKNDAYADQGGIEMNRVHARKMWCGSDLYDQIYEDLFSDGKPVLNRTVYLPSDTGTGTAEVPFDSERIPNVLRSKWGIELMPALQEIDDGDADMYFMTSTPTEADHIHVGFYRGRTEPELWVQDLPTVGSMFDSDVITHKIRFIFKAKVSDFRPFQVGKP